jgi:alpha-1,6-mannosyltransferase
VALPGSRTAQILALVVVVESTWIATRSWWSGPTAWVPLLASVAVHAVLVERVHRLDDLPGRVVVVAVALVAAVAVATAPFGSRDLFQYAFYGRMAAHHGADPYAVAPSAFADDPLFDALAPGWHRARSVYGPVFTWFSMAGASVFDTSVLAARLWFQGAAGLALIGCATRLRREVGVAAAVSVGLSPVLIAAVNGGHNDVLVGWLLLVATGPVAGRRPVLAGAVLGVAVCVKLSAAPVVAALVLVGVHRRAWSRLAAAAAGFGAVTIGTHAAGGGLHLLDPLAGVGARTSRASAWALLERVGGGSAPADALLAGAAAIALACVAVVAWRWRSAAPEEAATAAGAAASFVAPYVLPWYAAAILPVSGRVVGSRVAVVLQVGASALLVAYVVPPGHPPGSVPLAPTAAIASGLVLMVLVGALVGGPRGWSGYRRWRGQPGTGARRRRGVPRVPSAGGLARRGRPGEAGGLPRRGLLGPTRSRVR